MGTELFAIVKAKELRTFGDVLAHSGRGHGCEICKPAVASILASLNNGHILGETQVDPLLFGRCQRDVQILEMERELEPELRPQPGRLHREPVPELGRVDGEG